MIGRDHDITRGGRDSGAAVEKHGTRRTDEDAATSPRLDKACANLTANHEDVTIGIEGESTGGVPGEAVLHINVAIAPLRSDLRLHREVSSLEKVGKVRRIEEIRRFGVPCRQAIDHELARLHTQSASVSQGSAEIHPSAEAVDPQRLSCGKHRLTALSPRGTTTRLHAALKDEFVVRHDHDPSTRATFQRIRRQQGAAIDQDA